MSAFDAEVAAAITSDGGEAVVVTGHPFPARRPRRASSGTPQDVADAAAYLASGEASRITGVVLDVAGGALMV